MIRIIIILFVFFISCKTEPIRQEIEIGKTIKIEPSNFSLTDKELNFFWTSPQGPNKNSSQYKIQNNKMLFTPTDIGEYEISLTVESTSNNTLYEETFLFYAFDSGNYKIKDKEKINSNSKKSDNSEKKYTIQVASWPTLEQARNDQISLRESGYDAYTEQYYIKSKDQLWWRVRVGNFTDKNKATQVRNKLAKERGNDLWIDFIK